MPSPTEITVSQLSRLVGLPDCPRIVDVRSDEHFAEDPRLIPTAVRRDAERVGEWAQEFAGCSVVVSCQHGHSRSHGAAAWLRSEGIAAESLEGGHEAWSAAQGLLVRTQHLPPRDGAGRTLWVTRGRPKLDRIACPWILRRFVDRNARILYVPPAEVLRVAERHGAAPFDIEDVFFSHRGERCTFDVMLEEFGLDSPVLAQLAVIVRAADTARLDLAPEAAGLLAMSVGFSRMYRDDLAQLDAALPMYDALYRRLRDAGDETHNWPNPRTKA